MVRVVGRGSRDGVGGGLGAGPRDQGVCSNCGVGHKGVGGGGKGGGSGGSGMGNSEDGMARAVGLGS